MKDQRDVSNWRVSFSGERASSMHAEAWNFYDKWWDFIQWCLSFPLVALCVHTEKRMSSSMNLYTKWWIRLQHVLCSLMLCYASFSSTSNQQERVGVQSNGPGWNAYFLHRRKPSQLSFDRNAMFFQLTKVYETSHIPFVMHPFVSKHHMIESIPSRGCRCHHHQVAKFAFTEKLLATKNWCEKFSIFFSSSCSIIKWTSNPARDCPCILYSTALPL